MKPNESCWCGHQAQWHKQDKTYRDLYACKWCMKMQLRGKKYCDYEHQMAPNIPEGVLRQAADAMGAQLLEQEKPKMPRRTRGKGRFIKGMAPYHLKVVK